MSGHWGKPGFWRREGMELRQVLGMQPRRRLTGHEFRVVTALWALNSLIFLALLAGWVAALAFAERAHSRGWKLALGAAFWIVVVAALRGWLPKVRIRRR